MRHIYLDYNATTPIAPSVQEAMAPFLAEHFGNPSSEHALGRAAHEALEDARSQVARLLGAEPDEIVFTGGGTEASNLALKGAMWRHAPLGQGHLVISALEHPATVEPARYLERLGYDLSIVPCNRQGVVDPAEVEAALRDDTVLVSIMQANNEIGTIQPIAEIGRICRRRDVLLHTDAAQTIGKVPARVDDLNVDLMTLAGHKFYAPKGVGALYVRQGVALEPVLHGAGHERGMRPGTENVPYIVGMGKAALLAARACDDVSPRLETLRDRLQELLREAIGSRLTINGIEAPRLPNTLSVNFPGVTGSELLRRVPELCASTGSACHSDSVSMSPTLAALGLSSEVARGTVRLSLGWQTSEEDVQRAAELLIQAWEG